VSGREYKPVAIEPLRVPWIVPQESRPQNVSHGGGAHGHARMAGIGVLHGIGGQNADGVDASIFKFSYRFLVHGFLPRRASGNRSILL
jgi:hypothetical protein